MSSSGTCDAATAVAATPDRPVLERGLPRSLAVAAAMVVLAGCSSSGGGPGTPANPGTGMSQAQAEAALLSGSELGTALTRTKVDDTPTAFPCTPSAPPLDKQLPPKVKAESQFTNSDTSLQFNEEIDNYGSATTAARARALGEKGLACSSGSVNGIGVTITGPDDLAKAIKASVDNALAWSINSTAAKESIIVSQIGPQLVVLTFGASAGAAENTVDAAGITQKALAKASKAAG